MRTYVCLSVLLGLGVLLTVQYSFWLACGIIYFGVMLVVAVIAFAGRNSPSRVSSNVAQHVLPDEVEEQAA